MLLVVGVLIGLILSAVVALLIFKVEERFVLRVEKQLSKFTGDAYSDIEAFKQAVGGAIKSNTEAVTKIIVDVKKDVEIMKTRVGGAFSFPQPTSIAEEVKPEETKQEPIEPVGA